MNNLMLLLISSLICSMSAATLMRVKLSDAAPIYTGRNPIGFSLPWSMRSHVNNTMLRALMLNLNNQNKWSVAAITNWRPSAGADYDCSSTDAYCTDNITTAELNDTGRMIFDTTLQPAYLAGIRFDSINQTRWNKFISDLYLFSHNDTFIMNLGENADTYEARGARPAGYNMQSWIAEMNAFVAAVNTSTATGRYMIGGPGINSNSTAWVNNMSQVFANCTANPVLSCIFTMQMNFFENDTDVSLQNMLSETYFTRRFNQVFSDPTVLDSILKQNVAISRMKLHYGNGIDGLTNTFASALWAADFIFQWMTMSGYQIYFDTDVTGGSFQSPFTSNNNLGGSPALVVWPIYYAMLIQPFMLPPVGSDNYMLPTTNLYKGPYNIKVYAYRQPDTEYAGAVIINKDTNSTLTGQVELCFGSNQDATYYYLEADSLLEKTAIRFQGFSFNTTLSGLIESGTHQAFTASADANGCFSIPIKYAQLAVVEFQDPLPYVSVEQFNKPSFEQKLVVLILLLVVAMLQ